MPNRVSTSADAIRHAALIDMSAAAKEAGIGWPVAFKCGAWERCVTVPPGVECQDESGRLRDVLWMLRSGIARQDGGCVLSFVLHVRDDNRMKIDCNTTGHERRNTRWRFSRA